MPQPSALQDSMLPSSNSRSHLLHRTRPPTHSRKSSAFTPFSTIGEPNTYTTLFASTARKHLSGNIASPNLTNFDSTLSSSSDPRSSRLESVSAVWMVYVYAFISLVFFFSAAYSVLGRVPWSAYLMSATTTAAELPVNHSYLDDLSNLQRMAKLSSLQPPPELFEPSYIKADNAVFGVSASIWASDNDLGWVTSWLTEWDGPISLLVVSRTPQISQLHDIIAAFLRTSGIDTVKISIHLLQLHPSTSDIPNAFLNLARLFAPTSSVLLVPGTHRPLTISSLLPNNLNTPTLVLSANDTYSAATERDDVLAPVFLPRAHDVWCTERFFSPASPEPTLSRSADWSACLWQLHLDSLGGLGIVRSPSWHHSRAVVPQAEAGNASTLDGIIHRRLSVRYRSELCVLAIKRQEVLAAAGVGADAQGIRWLQTVCKPYLAGSLDSGSSKGLHKGT